jgi:ADP-heptose:LPS heptosyltransferase
MGDIVLTTPIIRCLKKQFPDTSIHFLIKKEYQNVLAHNPYIDKFHVFNGDLSKIIAELKKEKFDYIADLQHNFRSKRVTSALKVSYCSFPKLNVKKWLATRIKLNLLPNLHIVDRYFETVKPLGTVNDLQGLDFLIPKEQKFDIDDLPAVFEDGYVAIALGAQHETKRIPPQKVIEIAKLLYKPVLLLGGDDVAAIGDEIVMELGERAYNGCKEFTLMQSASLIQQSDCLLTGDTGMMHIAAALHKPVASVWSNTVPEFGMYPYMPNEREKFRLFEVVSLPCRPCSKLGYKKCPKKHFKCMLNIPSPEVAQWINLFSHDSI